MFIEFFAKSKKSVVVFLVILLLSIFNFTFGYYVRPIKIPGHYKIVEKALDRIGGFSKQARNRLYKECEVSDKAVGPIPIPMSPSWHFTARRNPWKSSVANIQYCMEGSIEMIRRNRSSFPVFWEVSHDRHGNVIWLKGCLSYLGNLFHVIADHYAHSNWARNTDWTIEGISFYIATPPAQWENNFRPSNDAPNDDSTINNYTESFQDAVFETIRQWYVFENGLFNINSADKFEDVFKRLRIVPGFNFLFTSNATGVELGSKRDIEWYARGIRPGTKMTLQLIRGNALLGTLGELEVTHNSDSKNIKYWPYRVSWKVGEYKDSDGNLKNVTLDRSEYKLRIAADNNYDSQDSETFLIMKQ